MPPVDPHEFVQLVQPLLVRQDLKGLLSLLRSKWTKSQLVGLLSCKCEDTRKVASLALSLVGCKECIGELVERLKDPDPVANEMAEHALWSIWFRSSTPDANHQICRGSQAMNDRDFEHAIEHFSNALEIDPKFAEAYNQRAIAHYLQEHYVESIADCRRAVELMPCHFGAWAGSGHCQAHLGHLRDAITCYRKALEINPHLEGISQTIQALEQQLNEGDA